MRALAALFVVAAAVPLAAQTTTDAPAIRPDAIVDLGSADGVALVRGQWRYSDAKLVEVDHRGPGPDLRASGAPNKTLDVQP